MKTSYAKMQSFMAKNAPVKMTAEELKKEADELYEKKLKEDAYLLKLYNEKKLTNKKTIQKARAVAAKYNEKKKDEA